VIGALSERRRVGYGGAPFLAYRRRGLNYRCWRRRRSLLCDRHDLGPVPRRAQKGDFIGGRVLVHGVKSSRHHSDFSRVQYLGDRHLVVQTRGRSLRFVARSPNGRRLEGIRRAIDDTERQRRTAERQRAAELWSEVLEINAGKSQSRFAEFQKVPFTPAERQAALSMMDSGAPMTVREALLFVGIASLVFDEMNADPNDRNAHEAFLGRLHSLVADACRFGELRWLVDGVDGNTFKMIRWQLLRESDEAGLYAYQGAAEAWQEIHAWALSAWAHESPPWDGDGERTIFTEGAPLFRVSEAHSGTRSG
jgi:hypothetical protein